MNFSRLGLKLFICIASFSLCACAAESKKPNADANQTVKPKQSAGIAKKPVTPNASPEAVKLLEYLYSISGKQTLVGQHCAPLVATTQLPTNEKWTGHYPALCGFDFGFSAPGTWDGINFRQRIVDEAIRRNNDGFIKIGRAHV